MTLRIDFDLPKQASPPLYFNDLDYNTAFRIATIHSKGAVYIKVRDKSGYDHCHCDKMLEIYKGELFHPTTSPVELVDVDVVVRTTRPSIYGSDIPF